MRTHMPPVLEQFRNQVIAKPIKNGPDKSLDSSENEQGCDNPGSRPNFLAEKNDDLFWPSPVDRLTDNK